MSGRIRLTLYAVGVGTLALPLVLQFIFPAPRLFCASPRHDFGVVPERGTVSHSFSVQNIGGRPLRISRIESSCTCATGRLSKNTILPGESAELQVALNLDQKLNTVAARVSLECNDPVTPNPQFAVIARLEQQLMVAPPVGEFGSVRYGETGQVNFEFEVFCRQPKALSFHVADIVSPSPVQARISHRAGPGRPRLHVWLNEKTPIGPLTAVVHVEERGNKPDRVELPVRGEVLGPVRCEPEIAFFGLVRHGTSRSKRIAILPEKPGNIVHARVDELSASLKGLLRASIVESGSETFLDVELLSTRTLTIGGAEAIGAVRLSCVPESSTPVFISVPVHLFLTE